MGRLLAIALALGAAAGASAGGEARPALTGAQPCATAPGFTCSALSVPLDRSGQVPGRLSLQVAVREDEPQAADRLVSCSIERKVRGWEKPSDHVPVLCDLAI